MRDADACLKLAPRFAKAHFAKGRALYFLSDYEAAFVQYDAGLRLEHHPRIAAWLEAERHKPEYATHAGPRALVRLPVLSLSAGAPHAGRRDGAGRYRDHTD